MSVGRIPPTCARTGGRVAVLSEPRGELYKTRELGSLYGSENIRAVWHFGFFDAQGTEGGTAPLDATPGVDTDNRVTLGVRYLAEGAEREAFRVTVGEDGKLWQGGQLLDTSAAEPMFQGRVAGMFIFAMDGDGRLYAADNKREFYAGRPIPEADRRPGSPNTTGLNEYYVACAEDLAARLVEGLVVRHFVGPNQRRADQVDVADAPRKSPFTAARDFPYDHYRSIWLDGPVECGMEFKGGSPPERPRTVQATLRRTPWSPAGSAMTLLEGASRSEPEEPPASEAREAAPVAREEPSPAPATPVQAAAQDAPAEDAPIEPYVPAGGEASEPYGGSGDNRYAARDALEEVPAAEEAVASPPPPVSVQAHAAPPASAQAQPAAGPPRARPIDWSALPSPDDPSPPVVLAAEDDPAVVPACLGTIQPGEGVFVWGPPRLPDGDLDEVRLRALFSPGKEGGKLLLQEEWEAEQDRHAQMWEQRERALAVEPDRKVSPDEPRSAPYQPRPFVQQPFPGVIALSEAPPRGRWVCRSCLTRRKKWPIVRWLQLDKARVEKAMAGIRAGRAAMAPGMLGTRLKTLGLIDDPTRVQLEQLGEIKAPRKLEVFHHSSFLAGAPVAAAGEFQVVKGLITLLTNDSGHYLPPPRYLLQVVRELGRLKADLTHLAVHFEGDKELVGPPEAQKRQKVLIQVIKDGALDPKLLSKANTLQDLRLSKGSRAHGAQDDRLHAVRAQIHGALGLRLSRSARAAAASTRRGPAPCMGLDPSGGPCKETAATAANMEQVPGVGALCGRCFRGRQVHLAEIRARAPWSDDVQTRPRSSGSGN